MSNTGRRDVLLCLTHEKFVVKKKTKVISCFVDFSKVFDCLSREES